MNFKKGIIFTLVLLALAHPLHAKSCREFLRTVSMFLNPKDKIIHFAYEKTAAQKTKRLVLETLKGLAWLISPVPLSSVLQSPTDSQFQELWKNPQDSEANEELLNKYKALQLFKERKAFMLRWPRYVKWVQRPLVTGFLVLKFFSIGFALNHQLQLGAQVNTRDAYLSKADALGPNQIQIINETVPFPHSALRMGSQVYSYGYTHMAIRPVREYLFSKMEVNDWMQGAPTDDRSSLNPTKWLPSMLGKLPRSVQIITLNLSPEEYAKLKYLMQESLGNRYYNATGVNDCTTMILRKIDEATDGLMINRAFDASPGQTAYYFSMLKSLGANRVERIEQISIDKTDWPSVVWFRNFYIGMQESRFFIELLPFQQPHRVYAEIRHGDRLEWREPHVDEELRRLENRTSNNLLKDPQVVTFQRVVDTVPMNEKDLSDFVEVIKFWLKNEMNRYAAIAEASETSLIDRTESLEKLRTLESLRIDWSKKLGTEL